MNESLYDLSMSFSMKCFDNNVSAYTNHQVNKKK